MSAIRVDAAKCVGCGACVRACASNALSLLDKKVVVDGSACTLCTLCVDACPVEAISLDRGGAQADCAQWQGVWVFAEVQQGTAAPVVLELLTQGRTLAAASGQRLTAVLPGGDEDTCALLASYGADEVLRCGGGEQPDEAVLAALLAQLVQQYKPAVLLFGATPLGRSLAPRLAARLGTGLTADCTGLEMDGETGLLRQTRPAFGGNLMATIVCPNHRPQMATVRPGVFPAWPAPAPGQVTQVSLPDVLPRVTRLARVLGETQGSLSSAELIVSVGRGIGVRKNLSLITRLAQLLGAQVGCSRPLVESGWMAYEHQIGQTGCSVAPKLLLTFGISGAIQHQAGIGGAGCIVAVNSDPEAPIFNLAHYKVVADCRDVLEQLIARLEQ